ncbi:MAG: hypothetical protein ABIB43_04500 [archaeon]
MTKKKNDLWGILVILVVIILFFGFVAVEKIIKDNKYVENDYNKFQFFYDENQEIWYTQIQIGNVPYNIPFYYHPRDLKDVVVEPDIENIILLKRPENIIITVPGDSSSQLALAGIEVSKITGTRFQVLKIPTASALNEPITGMPYATCESANEKTVVISFEKSKNNVIRSENRCIILEFKDNESVRVADTFVFHLLKIM